MRSILPAGCLLVLMVIICGCIQSPSAAPVTPAPTVVSVVTFLDTTATQHPRMAVNISAEETRNSVIVQVDGGNDAGSLASLNVRITNHDGTTVQRTIYSPEIGKPYSIQYYRNANADKINIVGTFSDGFQQTLLITTL
jgi:hypothetical protein